MSFYIKNLGNIGGYRNTGWFTLFDCLGDIGGYMGLLIGGSAITLFELLDLIVYNMVIKMCSGKTKKKHNRVPTRDSSPLPAKVWAAKKHKSY